MCMLEGAHEDELGEPQNVLRRLRHGATCNLDEQRAQVGIGLEEGQNHNKENKVFKQRESHIWTGNPSW